MKKEDKELAETIVLNKFNTYRKKHFFIGTNISISPHEKEYFCPKCGKRYFILFNCISPICRTRDNKGNLIKKSGLCYCGEKINIKVKK